MTIGNTSVYGLAESIVASGLPMKAQYSDVDFATEVAGVNEYIAKTPSESLSIEQAEAAYRHVTRAEKLASAPSGSGHCNFLSGVLVAFNITASQAWWLQAERYHFLQIVSSMSKMHRIKQMAEAGLLPEVKAVLDTDPNASIESLVYACPMSFELTARVSTNYLQLKTIYNQRRGHRLPEWQFFCDFIEDLPLAEFLIIPSKTI